MSAIASLVRRYIDRYNADDVEGMLACCADDVSFETVANLGGASRFDGKEDMRDILSATMRAFRNRCHTLSSLICDGDRAAAETVFSGVATAQLAHDVREGDEITIRGVTIFEARDGRLTRVCDYS